MSNPQNAWVDHVRARGPKSAAALPPPRRGHVHGATHGPRRVCAHRRGVLKTSASAAAAALNTAAKDAAATCATSRKPLPANHIAQTTSRLLRSAEENDVVRCQNDAARVSEMNAGQPMANDAPAVPQTPLGIYHNPADQRICVCGRWGEPDECSRRWPAANLATWQGKLICFCYVTGVLAFAVFMVVNCSTTDACRRDRD